MERQLAQHARQHEAVAHLGQVALREPELDTLVDEVVATVRSTLDLDACGVLKLREDEELLDILAKVGDFEGRKRGCPRGRAAIPATRSRRIGRTSWRTCIQRRDSIPRCC